MLCSIIDHGRFVDRFSTGRHSKTRHRRTKPNGCPGDENFPEAPGITSRRITSRKSATENAVGKWSAKFDGNRVTSRNDESATVCESRGLGEFPGAIITNLSNSKECRSSWDTPNLVSSDTHLLGCRAEDLFAGRVWVQVLTNVAAWKNGSGWFHWPNRNRATNHFKK